MDSSEHRREISRWLIGIFTCCILIYLGIRHFDNIVKAVSSLVNMTMPLLIGIILAMFLNVPMRMIERQLRKRTSMKRGIRGLSIVLAIVLVAGIIVCVAILVVPELINAVNLIIRIVNQVLNGMDTLDTHPVLADNPIGSLLAGIDWQGLQTQLQEFVSANISNLVDGIFNATSSLVGWVATFVIALVFSIYILAAKEKLKRQTCRLVRAWLPDRFGEVLIHVCAVCSTTFQRFISGQAIEAVILGSLCMIGMLILRIPFAAMVGAMVGVSAFIPFVGAYLSAGVGAIMILTVNPVKSLIFLIYILVLQQTENNLIYPRVVGSKINLPAMWVLAAVVIGGNLGGPIGMLLGVPAASAAYSLLREATEKREESKPKKQVLKSEANSEKSENGRTE